MTSSITRLCEHLKEAAFYSTKDLTGLQNTLDNMERSLDSGKEIYSPYLLDRIRYRLKICQGLLQGLRDFLKTLSPEMVPVWEKLVSILRSIAALNTRSKFSLKDLNDLRGKLKEIETHMEDGKMLDEAGNASGGQELVVPLLKRCLLFTAIVEQKQGKIDERFKETYDKLIEIRNHLERLTMTQAWSLRETDLYMWQRKLDRIDDSRRDGNFFDAEGHPADLHALTHTDSVISVASWLCIYLPALDRIRAGFGSTTPHLQPANDTSAVLG
jgi:vacuolar-type H+-ATPase subunit I/STV1